MIQPHEIRVAVLTVSDRCSRSEAVDLSGPALAARAQEALGALVVATDCVPDDFNRIAKRVVDWSQREPSIDLVLTTGGTGLAPRDVTPEAVRSVLEREAPGIMELARHRCLATTPLTFLSRGIAGTIRRTLVITLPGSPRGATEQFDAIADVLPHALATLRESPDGSTSVPDRLASICPIVLVGGRSSRFGRDKLREPLNDGTWLVDRPIGALRSVFGPRVALVGDCDASVATRGDFVICDAYPGVGPAGGILSALRAGADVFVLPGDLPLVTADLVGTMLDAALDRPDAGAVLALTDRVESCVGLYRASSLGALDAFVARGRGRLADALPREHVLLVHVDACYLVNANVPGDLPRNGETSR